ncbi:aminoglycoside phosphotransferase family protein [soil metagenome]
MTIPELADLWSVSLVARLPGSTCSEVWRGVWKGRDVVLKLPRPHAEEAKSLPTLRAFSGHGGVQVLEADERTGACLLPLLGSTLDESDLGDDENTRIFAEVALRLREAPLVEAMSYEEYAHDAFSSDDEILREPLLTISWLLETRNRTTLIHGDLHHFNLLNAGYGYVAIDPKGVLTDPGAEIVAYLLNPSLEKLSVGQIRNRLEIVAERWGESYDRLWQWAWAGNTVSSWWNDPSTCREKMKPIRCAR